VGNDAVGDEAARKGDEGVKQTLSNLDLLLGIEDKPEEDEASRELRAHGRPAPLHA
jgi:hypothetical protein